MWIFYLFLFLLGLAVGSFLNVVIIRLKTREQILKTRSHCPFCQKKLKWYELIPIISFIIQKGKCRKCHKRISWQYPLVEFFTGLIFILIFNFQFSIFNLIIACFLIILFVYDLKYYLVSDKIIYPAIIIAFLYCMFGIWNFGDWDLFRISDFGFGILIGGGFFLIIVLISREKWMGLGDVKIGILMGLILGWSNVLVALFLAFLSGAIVSLVLLILKKKTLKSEIPFGPFLTSATFITLLWGDILLKWYLDLICLR